MTRGSSLLVLGASRTNVDAIRAMAAVANVHVIVADGNPSPMCRELPITLEVADIRDGRVVQELAQRHRVSGIYAMNDHALRAAAYASGRLRLSGMSMATAHGALDKGAMREMWSAYGLPQPHFEVILHEEQIARFGSSVGYPIVIKPVDCGGGGRGVCVIGSEGEIGACFAITSRFRDRSPRMIVEQFVDGVETSVEVAMRDGEAHLVAFSEKDKPSLTSRVAVSIDYPGRFSRAIVERIRGICRDAMCALGIADGVGHVELIVTPLGDVQIIELGARVGGGHTFAPIASHVSGINYPEWVVRHSLGERPAFEVRSHKGAAYHFLYSSRVGRIRAIDGLDAARAIPGVRIVQCWKGPGDYVDGLSSSMERIGCVVALAETREQASLAAQSAMAELQVEIE